MAVESIRLEWVEVGTSAFGLVHDGRVVALVYWRGPGAARIDGLDFEPVVVEAGFSWVPSDSPWDHFYLFEAREPSQRDWERARRGAASGYFARDRPGAAAGVDWARERPSTKIGRSSVLRIDPRVLRRS
jgi:hypothetical protein